MPASPNGWFCTPQRKIALGALALALVLAFTVFRPPGTPGPIERDFEAYYAAGATVNAGGDPYTLAIWAAEARVPGVTRGHDEVLPFVGPAATLPAWALLARLPYRAAAAVWTIVLVGSMLVVLACALQLARMPREPVVLALTGGTAIAAAPLIGDFALGQSALLSAAAIAAAILAYRARSVPGALGATLLAAVQPNLAVALLGRMRSSWDAAIAGTGAAIFLGLTLGAGGGIAGTLGYVRRLSAHGAAERFATIQHTPAAIAFALGAAPAWAMLFGNAVAIIAVGVTAAVIVRERLDAATATLVCCAALPLAIPFFHEHDFVLELLPLLVLAMRSRGLARMLAAVAAVLVLVDWLGLAQRHSAQGQIVCLGLAVAFGFIGLGRAPASRGRDYAGLLALVGLAAVAVPVAGAHRAPTWPDALPAAYRADPRADVSTVWADEQRAAGLIALSPVWGALRGLPLAGCALLGVALVSDARDARRRRRTVHPIEVDRPLDAPVAV